jgi:hypothetical protein
VSREDGILHVQPVPCQLLLEGSRHHILIGIQKDDDPIPCLPPLNQKGAEILKENLAWTGEDPLSP